MRFKTSTIVILAVIGGGAVAALSGYVPLVHTDGPDKTVVESGGEIEVLSGGTLDVQSGATINLHGLTISSTEMGYLDSVTAGTQAAGKAVIADSNVNIGATKVTALHVGASGSETQVTATGAELNYTDVTTLGTAQASKAVTADANIDTTGQRNITATGTVQAEQLTTTDDATINDDISVGGDATVAGDITVSADATGGNAGARSNIIGLPKLKMVALGTMTNGTTETTAYIDTTPTGEWAEVDAGTNVAITADTTYYRATTNSVKIALGATAVAGDGVDGTITQDDLSGNESVGVWLYTDATTAVASGDFALTLDDTDGTDQTYVLPALVSGVWTWAELDISGCDANCNTTDGVKVLLTTQGATKYGVSTGEAINLYIDAMYKWDADDEETLGNAIIADGVLSVMTITTGQDQANTPAALAESTDYIIHRQTGNDAIVTVTDQSAASGIALIATE